MQIGIGIMRNLMKDSDTREDVQSIFDGVCNTEILYDTRFEEAKGILCPDTAQTCTLTDTIRSQFEAPLFPRPLLFSLAPPVVALAALVEFVVCAASARTCSTC
jgi:hypothetical protein